MQRRSPVHTSARRPDLFAIRPASVAFVYAEGSSRSDANSGTDDGR